MSMKKTLSLLTALLLLAAMVVGCTPGASGTATSGVATTAAATTETATSTPPAESVAATTEAAPSARATPETNTPDVPEAMNPMPIVTGTPVHLTYWCVQDGYAATIAKSQNEMRCFQELNRITNMNVEFIHPPTGSGAEALTTLIASNDLPDIIGSFISSYPGGVYKGIADGIFVPLNDYIDKCAPYYQRLRKDNPAIEKETMNDEGVIPGFYQVQPDRQAPWWGGMMRKDYLDKAGLGVPKTMDDWYKALTAFKAQGVSIPLNWNVVGDIWGGYFLNAYGVGYDMYVKDGHIAYGFIEQGYLDYMTEMSKWWKEGLLDKDYATRDSASRDENYINGKIGASQNTNWQVYNMAIVEKGLGEIVCPPYPVIEGRTQAHFRQQDIYTAGPYVCVTSACKTPDLAIRWLDYNYSEDGFMLRNFGVEGESYTLVDGELDNRWFQDPKIWAKYIPKLFASGKMPQFTDEIIKNPDGYEFYVALSKYKTHTGPFLRGDRTGEREAPFFAEARYDVWNYPETDQNLPALAFTTAESEKIAELRANIDTYRTEESFKFMSGARPLSEYSAYVEKLNGMGLADLVAIYEASYQRYMNRGK